MRTRPGCDEGSMLWRKAFSTTGWRKSAGTRQSSAVGSTSCSKHQPVSQPGLLDFKLAPDDALNYLVPIWPPLPRVSDRARSQTKGVAPCWGSSVRTKGLRSEGMPRTGANRRGRTVCGRRFRRSFDPPEWKGVVDFLQADAGIVIIAKKAKSL